MLYIIYVIYIYIYILYIYIYIFIYNYMLYISDIYKIYKIYAKYLTSAYHLSNTNVQSIAQFS